MTFHYYKKNKLETIKVFCVVVENNCNMTKAAASLHMAKQSVSSHIMSLEYDLKFKLFDRVNQRLVLTEQGKIYYETTAKETLNIFNKAFNLPTEKIKKIKKPSIIKILLIKLINFSIKQCNKMLVKITLKRIFFLSLLIGGCIYFYLERTNYFFDKKLESLANPLLKQVMADGSYRVPENQDCPFETTQINVDIYDMLANLTKEKKYENIIAVSYTLAEEPITSMRFSGDDGIDGFFNNIKVIPCNTERTYKSINRMYSNIKEIFEIDKSFKIYNVYYKPADTWSHSEYFFENVKKYPNQLFGIKIEKTADISNTRGTIIKHGNYYYLQSITNTRTAYDYVNNTKISKNSANINDERQKFISNYKRERHIIWKKLTLDELMHYDNGSYWKLIKDYGIKID